MNENKAYFEEWLEKGERDLGDAEILLAQHGSADSICFHAQQAAEKYAKGFLAYHGKEIRKIHNLEEILKDCAKIDKDMLKYLDDGLLLTKYYIDTRYPSPTPIDYGINEAKGALKKAKAIVGYIKIKIKKT